MKTTSLIRFKDGTYVVIGLSMREVPEVEFQWLGERYFQQLVGNEQDAPLNADQLREHTPFLASYGEVDLDIVGIGTTSETAEQYANHKNLYPHHFPKPVQRRSLVDRLIGL